MKQLLILATTALSLLLLSTTSCGWWVKGHGTIAEAACRILPEDMPAFFRAGARQLNHLAGEPDRFKNKAADFLRIPEAPDHYIDLEEFGGETLPRDRFKAMDLAKKRGVTHEKAGYLPYAIMEHHDRLACAFYDYRKEPDNEAVRMKCLVYAGVLSHYTGDACMPLHSTRDYDGRMGINGTLQQKGIHAKIDGFPETFGFTAEELSRNLTLNKLEDPWAHVLQVILDSHHQVEKCYEIDIAGGFDKPTEESRAFIVKHTRRATQFTAEMWYHAWIKSATMPPPY
ncbi:MAG TPA: hypothetical protein PKA06_09240 [Gemmatales bacterium]|nr:hypothetical protein [Gemmatales bacterium]HMP16882.1 hypothetical protein [Gemmatales bacterium]